MLLAPVLVVVSVHVCYGAARTSRPLTPPMGWNSYNKYNCYPNETIIRNAAQGLLDIGFDKLGYKTVTPDCGWPAANRTSDGQLVANPTLFPSGFIALGDWLHSKGLRFGIYSGAGVYQCGSNTDGAPALPASLGYEDIDAQTFAGWGGDALKYDNCWPTADTVVEYDPNFEADPSTRFHSMAQSLDKVARPIEYEVCQWGVGYDVGTWASEIASSWRISNDIYNAWRSIWRIANQVVPYVRHTRVGRYADMDMLIVGLNALTLEEERFHFGLWAISKSPLTMGADPDPAKTPQASLDILANEEVIAINQDSLGEQAKLVRRYTEEQYDLWAGNLSAQRLVVAVTNWADAPATISLDLLNELGVSQMSSIRDVWAAEDVSFVSASTPLSLSLAAHEAKLLVLSNVTLPTSQLKSRGSTYYAASTSIYNGSIGVYTCSAGECLPTGVKLVDLTPGSVVTFQAVDSASAGAKLIGVDFINYDVALQSAWTDGTNTRNMTISVNGGTPKRWAFPISGGDWFETGRLDVEVEGFVVGSNEVQIAATGNYYAPDLVGIEVFD